MKICRNLFFLISTLFLTQLPGQEVELDSIYELDNVILVDTRAEKFSTGYKVDEINSELLVNYQGSSLADMLAATSGLNIKSYGPGGLSSVSIRGGSSYHTAILWNGVNLQSPMNGGFNLSSLPMDLISSASIQYGGAGSLIGSGSAFGAVRLNSVNNLKPENNVFASTSYASYSNYRFALGGNFFFGRSIFSLKAFYQESENDFEFINTSKFGQPKEKQSNSAFQQYGFIVDNKTQINDNLVFTGSLLYQNYDKEVQTRMSDYNPSEAEQLDQNILLSTVFKYDVGSLNINLKNSYLYNQIDYNDPNSIEASSISSSEAIISELETNYSFNNDKHNFHLSINNTNEKAESSGYIESPGRNRLALIGAYKIQNLFEILSSTLSFRQEVIESRFNPLQVSFGTSAIFNENFSINYNIGKVYRVPTLNDLYWKDTGFSVGNPNLEDEDGWTSDFGLTENIKLGFLNLAFKQNLFYSSIEGLIVWSPINGGKWKPENMDLGRSKGVELGVDLTVINGKSKLSLENNYTYTDSQISNDEGTSWSSQLYIPKNNFNSIISYRYKNYSFDFIFNYYGERFIDKSGNSLDSYTLGDVNMAYNIKLDIGDLNLGFKVNNIWNTQYQLSADYAMPLANYSLSAKIIIK